MFITHPATVIACTDTRVRVRIETMGCGARLCCKQLFVGWLIPRIRDVEVPHNGTHYDKGMHVLVQVAADTVLRCALTAYGIPTAAIVLGAVFGALLPIAVFWQVVLCLFLLGIGVWCAGYGVRRLSIQNITIRQSAS